MNGCNSPGERQRETPQGSYERHGEPNKLIRVLRKNFVLPPIALFALPLSGTEEGGSNAMKPATDGGGSKKVRGGSSQILVPRKVYMSLGETAGYEKGKIVEAGLQLLAVTRDTATCHRQCIGDFDASPKIGSLEGRRVSITCFCRFLE